MPIYSILLPSSFQSTLPMRGETQGYPAADGSVRFQSTLPMRGETCKHENGQEQTSISIHSPHAGRDIMCIWRLSHDCIFQSTLPMRGETALAAVSAFAKPISIHSPHAGRDVNASNSHDAIKISIHSPHAGRDC